MAEALIQVVLENLNTLIRREFGLLWGFEKEMEKLSSLLSTIQAVLEDAEEKQLKDKVLRNWLLKLNDGAYEVDDILDECATEASKLQNKDHPFIKRLVSNPVGNILFRRKIGKRMEQVIEKLDAIAEERIKFHLREIGDRMPVRVVETRETGSILPQSSIFGRDQDKERIIEMVVHGTSDCEDVSVLPILGMGGLGKSTLAQMVFNDKRVSEHFDLRLWVCVTSNFDAKRLIREILESATSNGTDALRLDPLQRSLRDLLNQKIFLLVLDDVWNEDQDKWDSLKDVFGHGSRGSAIIITTRLNKVAMIVGTLPTYCLSGLSEQDCWSLFKQRAFGQEMREEARLEEIGREIVAKCGGVPLAAKALGGFMRFKKEEKEWLLVKESEIWKLPQEENGILPALRLSYHNLPFELRRCFAYCSVFGRYTEIKKEKLIHLWMANGFISSRGSLGMEDVGNEVWNELYLRSFFQDVRKNDYGEVVAFKMHDLIHDLAHSVMESSRISRQMLLRDHYHITKTQILKEASKFSRLRVLDASGSGSLKRVTKVPSAIGSLKHLRYLNLSITGIQTLPDTICDLWNLQILNLDYCWSLQSLPKCICRLKNLRHLCLFGCPLIEMPPSIGQLTCLKTLNKFVVGKHRGFKISELRDLNLGGTLHITNLERVESGEDAKEANLEGKQDLRHLSLSWDSEKCTSNAENHLDADIIKYLVPHSQLHSLMIYGFRGTCFPFWMSSPIMKGVVDISLANCKSCVNLPPIGELPSLKSLHLEGLLIEYVDNEFQGEGLIRVRRFPSLITLSMNDLPKLRKLSRQEGHELFPCLCRLYIKNCPLFTFPSFPSIKSLEISKFTNMVISTVSNLCGLTSLVISDNKELNSLPENMLHNLNHLESLRIGGLNKLQMLPTSLSSLTSLKSLHIYKCDELEVIPMQGLKSLTEFGIESCSNIKSLSEGLQHLTSLEKLWIRGCPELVALPIGVKYLSSLRTLELSGYPSFMCSDEAVLSPKLAALPEALQHVPNLHRLCIYDFGNFTRLPDWLGDLTHLQHLYISGCPKLASLPQSIQRMENLQTLIISKASPELQRRYDKGNGEHWHHIAHIPQVYITP